MKEKKKKFKKSWESGLGKAMRIAGLVNIIDDDEKVIPVGKLK